MKLNSKRALVALASALCVGVLVPAVPAGADEAAPPISATAWYWSTNKRFTFAAKDPVLGFQQKFDVAAGGPVGLAPGGGISPISLGHLGISMINGTSDMRAYARWDLSGVPAGSEVNSFIVTFNISKFNEKHLQQHLDSESRPPSTLGEDFARVDACPVTETLTSSEADPSYSFSFQRPEIENRSTDINRKDQRLEPLYDCGLGRIRGELDGTRQNLVFDLTRIAQSWVDDPLSNNGIAMIGVAEGVTTTWMLELHGPAYTARVDTGLPVGAPVPLPETPEQPANVYVTPEDAVKAAIAWTPGEPDPIYCIVGQPCDGSGGGGTTVITNNTNTTTTVEVPGEAPPPQTIYMPISNATVPVGDVTTPGWMMLAIPAGLLALGAMFSAIGKDELAVAGGVAGSRVASLLQARRLQD